MFHGKVTLREIDEHYDINDLLNLHEVMDLMEEAERRERKFQEMSSKMSGRR